MSELHTPTQKKDAIDEERRRFLLGTACALGGIGALCATFPFISSWLPNAQVQAEGAPVQVDLSRVGPGEMIIVAWRGKPVWILRRTQAMLAQLSSNTTHLRDPQSLTKQQPQYAQNEHRSINPEYLILIGICTHLGCTPKYKPQFSESDPNGPGGFFCPCHGSRFDLSGRVFKNVPAPINMEIPPHYFLDKKTVIIGEEK